MQDGHDGDEHLGGDVGVEVDEVVEVELGHVSECALEELLDVFELLLPLDMVHGLAFRCHVETLLLLVVLVQFCEIFGRLLCTGMLAEFASERLG